MALSICVLRSFITLVVILAVEPILLVIIVLPGVNCVGDVSGNEGETAASAVPTTVAVSLVSTGMGSNTGIAGISARPFTSLLSRVGEVAMEFGVLQVTVREVEYDGTLPSIMPPLPHGLFGSYSHGTGEDNGEDIGDEIGDEVGDDIGDEDGVDDGVLLPVE